jgi:pimeloyl-ACP methyl ester carboxylesterase
VITIAGIEVFVREGARGGRPVLLLNGIGANSDMWGALEERLSQSLHTITVDAPGCGRSSTPPLPLPVSEIAALTRDLLDELGQPRVDVLGYSFGGLVAQELARQAPDRVGRMALAATACGWGSRPGTLASLALISTPLRYHSRFVYEHTNGLLSPADSDLVKRVPTLSEARLRHPPPLLGYCYQLAAGMFWSSLPWLHAVEVPTLVLAGALDHLVPAANGVQLARLLPNARLHLLPDEGHLFVFDPESASHSLLEEFFSAEEPETSDAWSRGTAVEDDDVVDDALASSVGAQPHWAISDAYRRFVQAQAPPHNGNHPS